jgi:hypothetical protein
LLEPSREYKGIHPYLCFHHFIAKGILLHKGFTKRSIIAYTLLVKTLAKRSLPWGVKGFTPPRK